MWKTIARVLWQPIAQWTTRGLVITVAAIALMLHLGIALEVELERRGRHFQELADAHYSKTINGRPKELGGMIIPRRKAVARDEWHSLMGWKYDFAARNPWLPVAPDPPEPK
jgi:hypothetical protein